MSELMGVIKKEKDDDCENSEETSANSQLTPSSSSTNNTPNLAEVPKNLKRRLSSNGEEKVPDLYILHIPMDWSQKDVQKFILDEYKEVKKINMSTDKDCEFAGIVILEFETSQQCARAKEIFNGKQIEGRSETLKACSIIDEDDYSSDEDASVAAKRETSGVPGAAKSEQMDQSDNENRNEGSLMKKLKQETSEQSKKLTVPDILDSDPSGLFGLKPEFLKNLDITPPLSKWIHISNFRCDRSELKEVLELAGRVVMCKVVHNIMKKHARAMYSHPLEAVQAISMLHNQMFYGMPLKITMESFTSGYIPLPNGLAGIGQGLGSYGQPLADVSTNFEKYLKKRKSELDAKIFRTPEEIERDLEEYTMRENGNKDAKSGFNITSDADIPDWVKNKLSKQSRLSESPKNDALALALRTKSPKIDLKESNSPTPSLNYPSTSYKSSNSKYMSVSDSIFPVKPSQAIPLKMNTPTNFPQLKPFIQPNTYPVPPQNVNNSQNMLQNRPQMIQNPQLFPGTWGPPRPQQGIAGPPGIHAGGIGPRGPQPRFVGAPMVSEGRPSRPFPPSEQVGPAYPNRGQCTTVEISNLPLSTTFPLLTEKMSEIGAVLSVQLTAPGCAVVQFHHSACADKCYRFQKIRDKSENGQKHAGGTKIGYRLNTVESVLPIFAAIA